MSDVQCPYCGAWDEVCPDNDYGKHEDEIFHHECIECEKIFAFTATIIIDYNVHKADCLNGGEHIWWNYSGNPFYPDRKECTKCGEIDNGKWHEWKL